jgi:hypothetical protein
MTWQVCGGEAHELYLALLEERCVQEGLDTSDEVLARQLRLHVHRGIGYLASPQTIRSIADLVRLVSGCKRLTKADETMAGRQGSGQNSATLGRRFSIGHYLPWRGFRARMVDYTIDSRGQEHAIWGIPPLQPAIQRTFFMCVSRGEMKSTSPRLPAPQTRAAMCVV